MTRTSTLSILVINPNSSHSVTEVLENTIHAPPGSALHYFTGPPSAPPAINDEETAQQSLKACLPPLLEIIHSHGAFLVACYSDHLLVGALKERVHNKPVIGIFEASITHALLFGKRFGIVTTGKPWEEMLTAGVNDFLGVEGGKLISPSSRFAGVASTGLGVIELHDAPREVVFKKMGEAAMRVVREGADVICLGCAGMVGLDDAIREGVRGSGVTVVVIDGVASGVEILAGMARALPSS